MSADPAFGSLSQAENCTLGRRALGYCTLSAYASDITPAYFQYFSDPKLGGKPMEDYCPIWSAYNNWDCRYPPDDQLSLVDAAAARRLKV